MATSCGRHNDKPMTSTTPMESLDGLWLQELEFMSSSTKSYAGSLTKKYVTHIQQEGVFSYKTQPGVEFSPSNQAFS